MSTSHSPRDKDRATSATTSGKKPQTPLRADDTATTSKVADERVRRDTAATVAAIRQDAADQMQILRDEIAAQAADQIAAMGQQMAQQMAEQMSEFRRTSDAQQTQIVQLTASNAREAQMRIDVEQRLCELQSASIGSQSPRRFPQEPSSYVHTPLIVTAAVKPSTTTNTAMMTTTTMQQHAPTVSASPSVLASTNSIGSSFDIASLQHAVPVSAQSSSMFRAKVYDLPEFDGKPEDWLIFNAEYEQSTAEYGYSDAQNVSRLRKCLRGPAREAVCSLLVRPDNVQQAMMTLSRQFGKPQCLVASQLKLVRDIPAINENRLDQLVPLAAKVANMVAFLDTPRTQQHLCNPMLIDELLMKLPQRERREWGRIARNIEPYPSLKDVSGWLQTVADELMEANLDYVGTITTGATKKANPFAKSNSKEQKNQCMLLADSSIVSNTCNMCCKPNHTASECYWLTSLATDARWKAIKEKKICSACLGNHDWRDCERRGTCGIDGCQKQHHPVLHSAPTHNATRSQRSRQNRNCQPTHQPDGNATISTGELRVAGTATNNLDAATTSAVLTPGQSVVQSAHAAAIDQSEPNRPVYNIRAHEAEMLFRVVPVILIGPRRTIRTHALLDEGSSLSLMDEEMAEQLELDGKSERLNVRWFGEQSASEQSRIVNLRISGVRNGDAAYQLNNVRTVKKLKLPTQTIRIADLHERYRNMRKLPIDEMICAKPRLLIGLDHCHLGVADRTIGGINGGAVAARTKLGWIVYGPRPHAENNREAVVLHVRTLDALDEIHRLVHDYFTTENFGVHTPVRALLSEEETRARQILDRTTIRIGDRFQTGLLWKTDNATLPPSRQMALHRLYSIEAKMRRNAEYAQQYRRQVDDFVRKGYARRMTDEEVAVTSPHTWYLPHFAVVNINKPGKFRLVFDAAAAVRGISLNSALSKGPDLHKPLPDVLSAFRVGRVAVCGDIREMFCQIKIQPGDQDAQRFLWRDGDSNRPVETFVMTSMTFGATCSPCSAHFVRNRNAEEHRPRNEEALRSILDHHYVDDYVASFQSAEKAIEITAAVTAIHREGGFELRAFVSNDRRVQAAVGGTQVAETSGTRGMELEPEATEKILGLSWDADADMLVFRCQFNRVAPDVLACERRPSKREMLSITMSVFDPFGMVADYMLCAKLLLQETWTIGVAWDGPIPDAIHGRWLAWQQELPKIATCRLPRCYSPWLLTSKDVQLHVFADASELAFAAVAYWRIGRPDGGWDVAFVAGKTRCAPKKLLSVPRLELQAAVLAVRLSVAIRSAHEVNDVKLVFWSDSRTVVCWIRSHHRRYKPFVAHRIAEILEDSAVTEWRWIPTGENVADDATRPAWPPKFDADSRWLCGPVFLQQPSAKWPLEPDVDVEGELPEQVPQSRLILVGVEDGWVPYSKFNRYVRLKRMTAWMLRFARNARQSSVARRRGELEPQELAEAEIVLCKEAQREIFGDELRQLGSGENVATSSSIVRLRPYLDERGVMRLRGRLDAALQMPAETRRPIILPNKHELTDLIVNDEHIRMRHQNDEAIVCAVRERFWVTHARSAVRRVKKACQRCRLTSATPVAPMMGALPVERVTPVQRPFTYTGLDYFGPVYVTVGRRREKRWVALFTCMSVRAVHLELAADLSTDACILCIRNFVNLRGVPLRIRSDNGTNFVGAERELRDCVEAFDQDSLSRECSGRGIEWRFNCPANPEAGGCWERLVRSVKRVLSVTMTEIAPRVETMRSLLIEAANIVNSRPLTHLPVDCDDDEPLTPNHFILGTANSTQTPGPLDPGANCSRKQWRIAQDLKDRFWKRWMVEYLPELTRRTKWFAPTTPLAVGDLVLVCDRNLPRSQWKRGRIEKVYPGMDGQVRTALLRTATGQLRRPANMLAVLDVTPRDDKGENPPGLVTGGAVADRSAR